MRIDINHVSSNQVEVQKSSPDKAAQQLTSAKAGVEDTTSLSSDSASVRALQQQALAAPEVRLDKVESLKQQIQSGSYQLDPKKIAQAMREDEV